MKLNMKKLLKLLPLIGGIMSSNSVHADEATDFWQTVYDARSEYYESHIGKLPNEILKMANMTGVWIGGGLYVIPAKKLGDDLWVYTTFGLSNSDMPATTQMENFEAKENEYGNITEASGKLKAKTAQQVANGLAGYGYELIIIAKENAEWPLWVLQWAVNAEIGNDVGLLNRVEKYHGLTIEDIQVGDNESVNILIEKAQSPMPQGTVLPNGHMTLLIATVITDDEMQWSMKNGRDALLDKLLKTDTGQVSIKNRKSVIK